MENTRVWKGLSTWSFATTPRKAWIFLIKSHWLLFTLVTMFMKNILKITMYLQKTAKIQLQTSLDFFQGAEKPWNLWSPFCFDLPSLHHSLPLQSAQTVHGAENYPLSKIFSVHKVLSSYVFTSSIISNMHIQRCSRVSISSKLLHLLENILPIFKIEIVKYDVHQFSNVPIFHEKQNTKSI